MNSTVYIHRKKLLHNIHAIQSRLNPGVLQMAVIKDNAYGHGLVEVANTIADNVAWFCVARASEGAALREAGIKNPILVFEIPRQETVGLYPRFSLTMTISDLRTFDIIAPGTEYHVNFDTGMRRLGVEPNQVQEVLNGIQKQEKGTCTGIYTHFFKADDPGNAEVEEQLELFNSIRAQFSSELLTHTANTGGIFHYGDLDLQFDAVRPGVCVFGYGAGDVIIDDLEPVLEWKSWLMQVKPISKGQSVSYGAKWEAPEDGFIGTIPTGYAAGVPRLLTNQMEVNIEGSDFPQVGIITMDYMMIYLGTKAFEPETEVTLLGTGKQSAQVWAKKAGTIPYEITTSIKARVPKRLVD
ncbi:MAG: alanine racemase [Balneolales bacterium]|nr:alanine racemase [Balneolales bacterium]